MTTQNNYADLQQEIHLTALQHNRNPEEISLIAVTKHQDWQRILPIYQQGQRDFGESRVQEALEKQSLAAEECHWHFIGSLQKNKVRKAIGRFALIHSVDSFELAEKISQCSKEVDVITHILLQANTSGEVTKHGHTPQEWIDCFYELLKLPCLSIDGLMTLAPFINDCNEIRSCFASLRHLRKELADLANGKASLHHLSMGMSHDFKLAIAEGATLLRIGSAIFG